MIENPNSELERLRRVEQTTRARYERLRRHDSLLPERIFVDAAKRIWKEAEAAVQACEARPRSPFDRH